MAQRIRNYFLTLMLTVCSLGIMVVAAAYYVIATENGTKRVLDFLLLRSARYGSISMDSFEGTIARGLVLKNVVLRNSPVLGPRAVLRLQRTALHLPSFNWQKLEISVFNGRLDLPQCEPLIFNGRYVPGTIAFNAFGRALDVSVITASFLPPEYWKNLHGSVSSIEASIAGPVHRPLVKAHFYVDKIRYGERVVREGFARADMYFSRKDDEWRMEGVAVMENGLVNIHNASLELLKSKAIFSGDVLNPQLNINLAAQKDIYDIDIKIEGYLRIPQVHVRADPYLSEDSAMMLLGLGQWSPSQSAFGGDYERMGFKRRIVEDFKVGFQLEKVHLRPGDRQENRGDYYRTLQGEFALSDKLSVDIDERLYTPGDTSNLSSGDNNRTQNESRLYLKYKNRF